MSRRGENIRKRKDGRWEGRYIKGRKPDRTAIWGYIYGHTYTEVKKKILLISIIAGAFCQRRQNALAVTVAMLTHDCEVDN